MKPYPQHHQVKYVHVSCARRAASIRKAAKQEAQKNEFALVQGLQPSQPALQQQHCRDAEQRSSQGCQCRHPGRLLALLVPLQLFASTLQPSSADMSGGQGGNMCVDGFPAPPAVFTYALLLQHLLHNRTGRALLFSHYTAIVPDPTLAHDI